MIWVKVAQIVIVFCVGCILAGERYQSVGNRESPATGCQNASAGRVIGRRAANHAAQQFVDFFRDRSVSCTGSGRGNLVEIGIEIDGKAHRGAVVLKHHGVARWLSQGGRGFGMSGPQGTSGAERNMDLPVHPSFCRFDDKTTQQRVSGPGFERELATRRPGLTIFSYEYPAPLFTPHGPGGCRSRVCPCRRTVLVGR